MGIVVTIAMLLGLILTQPFCQKLSSWTGNRVGQSVATVLFLLGLWNIVWYGFRHLNSFWGIAAIISGIFMVTSSCIIFSKINNTRFFYQNTVNKIARPLQPFSMIVFIGLSASFLVYAITLIRLNLGFSIIA